MHVGGTFALEALTMGRDVYALDAPVTWQADITNTGEAFLVMGSAEATVVGECGRCLEPAQYALQGEIEGYYLVGDQPDMPLDEDDEQDFDVLGEDHVIDFEPLIVGALALELPLVPLCTPECKGLCPACGANLNQGDCGCSAEDDKPDAANPFAVLKDFKFE